LLKNNAGYRLPCWWGITPGKTTWKKAQNFLMPITYDFIFIESPEGFTKLPISNTFIASFQFPAPKDVYPYYPVYNFTVDNGDITTISTDTIGDNPSYNLLNVLNIYGQPEEVYIRTYQNPYEDRLPFEIVLFYPTQGIMVAIFLKPREMVPQLYPAHSEFRTQTWPYGIQTRSSHFHTYKRRMRVSVWMLIVGLSLLQRKLPVWMKSSFLRHSKIPKIRNV
jgi:hypothetical protein